jgi:hypothetical protein
MEKWFKDGAREHQCVKKIGTQTQELVKTKRVKTISLLSHCFIIIQINFYNNLIYN